MDYQPITKTCIGVSPEEPCGKEFVWGTKDQEYYAKNQFAAPKRCKDCARKKRAAHQKREDSAFNPNNIEGYKKESDAELLGER